MTMTTPITQPTTPFSRGRLGFSADPGLDDAETDPLPVLIC